MRTLNPATAPVDPADAAARRWLHPLIFETLVTVSDEEGIKPALALDWQSDATATHWRFRLRPNVKLHDGTRLDAGRVAAALSANEGGWTIAAAGDSLTIESDRGLPDLLWRLADIRHAIAFGRPEGGEPIGTGSFAIDRWAPRRLRLRAHDEHWAGRPFLDAVVIDMGRPLSDQIASIEIGRTDVVALRPQDVRRLSPRGVRVAASLPVELVALVFEGHRALPATKAVRRALALAVDRPSMSTVLLQRQGQPAAALLPQWLSGYAALIAAERDPALARSLVGALPVSQRTLTLGVGSDALLRSVAERVAVDAREIGLSINIPPINATALTAADVRIVRVRLEVTTPERALLAAIHALGLRATNVVTAEGPAPGASLDAIYRFERGLLEPCVIVPLVHLPELYAFGPKVEAWNEPMVLPTGAWNLANLWLRPDTPFDQAQGRP